MRVSRIQLSALFIVITISQIVALAIKDAFYLHLFASSGGD